MPYNIKQLFGALILILMAIAPIGGVLGIVLLYLSYGWIGSTIFSAVGIGVLILLHGTVTVYSIKIDDEKKETKSGSK